MLRSMPPTRAAGALRSARGAKRSGPSEDRLASGATALAATGEAARIGFASVPAMISQMRSRLGAGSSKVPRNELSAGATRCSPPRTGTWIESDAPATSPMRAATWAVSALSAPRTATDSEGRAVPMRSAASFAPFTSR